MTSQIYCANQYIAVSQLASLKSKFNQPENLLRNWDLLQPFQRRSESLTEEGLESSRN